ncbi:exosomal polycystin-1-interacting protein-like [Antennarius striatus]|uniref:exosomal polycystin-1-interacting protein-like n=1 Tax=Antennarius striatus TaxID=241820 RepID=UPI0035ADFD68
MEMHHNTVSSAPLPWSLWLLFLLTPVAPVAADVALLFDSGAPTHHLRNCSCPAPVRGCDEALANALCRCHTVPRSALPPAGLGGHERLTVWVKERWVLQELLNGSRVGHLHLSFCGLPPMDGENVALLGLRTLRIHSTAPGATYPHQEMTITPSVGVAAQLEALTCGAPPSLHVTLLDLAVLSGVSPLKAYTLVGPTAHTLHQNLPHLGLPLLDLTPPASPDDPPGAAEPVLFTFIY